MSSELRTMMQDANPIPTIDHVPEDEFKVALLAIETSLAEDARPRRVSALLRLLRRMRMRPGLVFSAAMAGVVLAVAVPLLLLATREGDVAEPTVMTTPESATVTTLEAVVPVVTEISWRRVPDQPAFENAAIDALSPLVEGGPGLVAVGAAVEGFDFFLWEEDAEAVGNATNAIFVSADGVAWERVDLPSNIGTLHGVASGPEGTLVAVGNDGSDAAIWASVSGLEWNRVSSDVLGGPDFQNILRVVAGGPGFVAVGQDGSDAGVWVSHDGYDWTKVEDEDLLAGDDLKKMMFDVTAGGPGLVAVGAAGLWDGDDFTGAAWVSRDGYDWERLPDGTFAAETGTTGLESVTASPATGRLIAFGSEMWTSEDGYHWVVTERDLPSGGPNPGAKVAWHGHDAVAAGYDARRPFWLSTPWVSGDGGISWTQVEPVTPTFEVPYDRAVSVAWFDARWVVAGKGRNGGVVWIGTPDG